MNLFLILCFLGTFLGGCFSLPTGGIYEASDFESPSAQIGPGDPGTSLVTVRFLDVGQADAALIECDGHYMLIDGGNKDDSSLLYSTLRSHNITHLDLVIGTHADEDHIGGLSGALYFAEADLVLCSTADYESDAFSDFKKYADLRGGGIQIPQVGDSYELGDALVEILAVNSGTGSNDTSIVTKLTYGQTSFLFTGDAETDTEQFLLNSGVDLQTTVLKVSHHGSNDSSSEAFLQTTQPEYAILSVGADNPYGHPDSQVLRRLEAVGSDIYRTDHHGTITCYSDGTTVTIATEYSSLSGTTVSGSRTDTIADADRTLPSHTAESADFNYILNIRSKKFHKPSCESVSKMSDQNRLEFAGSREEVLALDYAPCGSCKP